MTRTRETAIRLWRLLKYNGYNAQADKISVLLNGDDLDLIDYFSSDELWSGRTCIMESAFMDDQYRRHKLQSIAIDIGCILESCQISNSQAKSWISAFRQWHTDRNSDTFLH